MLLSEIVTSGVMQTTKLRHMVSIRETSIDSNVVFRWPRTCLDICCFGNGAIQENDVDVLLSCDVRITAASG